MVNDALSDLVAQIKNGYRAGLTQVSLPWSRVCQAVAQVLAQTGYLLKCQRQDNLLLLDLKYVAKEPALSEIRRVSRPGLRRYWQVKDFPRRSLGIYILSTPKGIVTHYQARKQRLGGEIICQVW